ncbi:sensor histidine kinase [Streptomyces sp. NBC_00690]|uniref:sensor histidine kinase n=1 Tax=Streptomyces sp. NBC_00690 TaxID=2975808 RepID=UPI002E287FFE|nr:histidine kinase [Streptomyces sp. NBC_00690]
MAVRHPCDVLLAVGSLVAEADAAEKAAPHNEPVGTEDGHGWCQQLRGALRPEAGAATPTHAAVRADVVLAVVLTVVALVVAARYPDAGPHIEQGVPPHPVPPIPPPGLAEPQGGSSATLWLLIVLSALPLAARRRYPLAAFALVMGATLAMDDEATWMGVVTCVIGAYGAVVHSRYRLGSIIGLGIAAVLAGIAFQDAEPLLPGWSSPAVVLLIAGVSASLIRLWRRQLAASRDRYAQLQQAQDEAMRRAVDEERSRIAAELHDVVTHNVSVMVIQAGAARKVMDTTPERSKEALLVVEAGGRAAMAELRQVMGLLAAPDHERPDGMEPQPGLERLDVLVERVRAAGTPVRVTLSLPADPLPPGVDLAAYRVVQEALTNTIKHAPGATADVTISHTETCLEIEVTDTGGVKDSGSPDGNGRGLIGLRERLAVYRGELTAGPTLAGGYRITARFPRRTG